MATTSLWHIEGRLISYVENPEKTRTDNPNLQPLWDVFSYVSRPEATEEGEYVSSINCLKEIALQQMILTKKQYGKKTDISHGTVIKASNPAKLHPNRRTKSDCKPQRKCGENSIRLSLLPTLIKTICTIIFALIPYLFWTERNITIPNQSKESSVRYPTGSAGNTDYPS